MIIDLSCPVELRGYELLHDDSGAARAYIDLFNVSDDTVSGYTATVRWTRDGTDESVNDYVSVDKIAIPGGGEFRLMLSTAPLRFADRLEMYFSSVSFQDGSVWKSGEGELVDVGESVPLQGEELDRLRRTAGEDAVMYPETQDDFWRCVCGRINPLSQDECIRCRRERAYVLGELNRKAVNMGTTQRKARAQRKKRAHTSSEKSREAEKRAELYTALMLIACVAFALISLFVILL